jgi:hypothetical protein
MCRPRHPSQDRNSRRPNARHRTDPQGYPQGTCVLVETRGIVKSLLAEPRQTHVLGPSHVT